MDTLIPKKTGKPITLFCESAIGPVKIVLLEGLPTQLSLVEPLTPRLSQLIAESQRKFPLLYAQLYKTLVEGEIFGQQLRIEGISSFYKRVLERVKTIPKGTIKTYSELAKEVGSPRAVRAVGSALAKNPLPLLIPCHRVVKKNGCIGSFSMGGRVVKEKLLEKEGFVISKNHKIMLARQDI
ncbi:methylated-DNA--[protein]-cysteine S-methyltransferase [Methylacidiphilum caldifontis]|uniref:methylated-DNA--[protein]-cysteine S-methyltransferase n=1 Tax=Methylacidiphilum caldifontis TaxID=2795386 RepID=A0A4Y8PHZ2_9BACT|nr:MGMT family protein [Methylacidiphilum caldifontis]TFE73406.1 cysteine methyltransferase [Methylacidiphilum caldifontis]